MSLFSRLPCPSVPISCSLNALPGIASGPERCAREKSRMVQMYSVSSSAALIRPDHHFPGTLICLPSTESGLSIILYFETSSVFCAGAALFLPLTITRGDPRAPLWQCPPPLCPAVQSYKLYMEIPHTGLRVIGSILGFMPGLMNHESCCGTGFRLMSTSEAEDSDW